MKKLFPKRLEGLIIPITLPPSSGKKKVAYHPHVLSVSCMWCTGRTCRLLPVPPAKDKASHACSQECETNFLGGRSLSDWTFIFIFLINLFELGEESGKDVIGSAIWCVLFIYLRFGPVFRSRLKEVWYRSFLNLGSVNVRIYICNLYSVQP